MDPREFPLFRLHVIYIHSTSDNVDLRIVNRISIVRCVKISWDGGRGTLSKGQDLS